MIALIWECLLKAALVLGLALAADALLRNRLSAAQRHLLWISAIAMLLLLPALRMIHFEVAPMAYRMPAQMLQPQVLSLTVKADGSSMPSTFTMLGGLWALGAAGLLLRLAVGQKVMGRIEQRSRFSKVVEGVEVRFSPEVSTPVTWRASRPVILLPANAETWTSQRLHMVMTHELAHIRRFDLWSNWVVQIAAALYWPNPLVWLAVRKERTAREIACDDVVVSSGPAHEYASELLQLSRAVGEPPQAALAMARPAALEVRIRHILDNRTRRAGVGRKGLAAVVGLAFIAAVPVAALRPEGGRVTGKVVSASSTPILGAKIVLTDAAGNSKDVVTDADGNYVIEDVVGGAYKLVFDAAGFRSAVIPGIQVRDGKALNQRVTLQPETGEAVSVGLVKPKDVYKFNPSYPEGAKARRVQGDVWLKVLIGADGNVVSVSLISSPDPELSEAAIDAVKQWRFSPARQDGTPVEASAEIKIHFSLR